MHFENLSLLESFKYEWEPLESIVKTELCTIIWTVNWKRYKMTTNEREKEREDQRKQHFFSYPDQS